MSKWEKFKEWYDDFHYEHLRYNWVYDKTTTLYYKVRYGVENLIVWFVVVWTDRDWDHAYLYMVLRHKLARMSKLHREGGHCANADTYADDIDKVVAALDRLIEDDYIESVFHHHDKKWGEISFGDDIKFPMRRRKVLTKEDEKKEIEESRILYDREHILRQRDHDFVFTMLMKHLPKWWD